MTHKHYSFYRVITDNIKVMDDELSIRWKDPRRVHKTAGGLS